MIPVFAFLICALLRALPPCARIKDWRERSAADAESRHTRALLETLEQLDGQQDELRPKQKLLKEYLQQEAAPAEAGVAGVGGRPGVAAEADELLLFVMLLARF